MMPFCVSSEVKGSVVLLDDEGRLQCSILGTDPSMFSRPPVETRDLDYSRANTEMAQLQKSIAEQQGKMGELRGDELEPAD